MPSTVEQLSPTRVKITVEVPFADLKPSMDKAYADIARTVNIPGFRRGKVPPMVIDQRFGRGVVIQEAFNDSWSRFYGEAVTENALTPLAHPTSPFSDVPREDARDASWVEPVLGAEVSYGELTGPGRMRHPVWRGIRPDKGPDDVVWELPGG